MKKVMMYEMNLNQCTSSQLQLQRMKVSQSWIWLPEAKVRYKTKRRQMDLDMARALWNTLPLDVTNKIINKEDVPKNISKRYDKVMRCSIKYWYRKDDKVVKNWKKNVINNAVIVSHSEKMVQLMKKAIPKSDGKMVTHIPKDFRSAKYERNGWDWFEYMGASMLLFLNLYRLSTCFYSLGDHKQSLKYANEALSLLPPLGKDEMPYKYEVYARMNRAQSLFVLKDYENALNDFRLSSLLLGFSTFTRKWI